MATGTRSGQSTGTLRMDRCRVPGEVREVLQMRREHKVTLTSLKTGKKYNFKSNIEASHFLSRSKSYVSTGISHGFPLKHGYTGERFVASYPEEIKRRGEYQPCCTCKNAVFGCSWSRDFTPVEGWKAIPTIIHHGDDRDIPSFKIIFCPQYERG